MKMVTAVALLLASRPLSAEAASLGATIEMAAISKVEHGVFAPIPVLGLMRVGDSVSPWIEAGTYEVPYADLSRGAY